MLQNEMLSALRGAFADPANPEWRKLPSEIHDACEGLVKRGSDNCTLVALTNVAGAAADPSVRPQFLAKQAGGVDFRSLYKKTTRSVLVDEAARLTVSHTPSTD